MIKVGIDIGNSKISSIVCDVSSNGSKKILSFISNPTNNVKKSLITNLSSLKEEINKTINIAAKESQTDIKSINLNLPAVDSLSKYSNSEVTISSEMINELHIKKAINLSNILESIENFETVNNLIIGYDVDNNFLRSNGIASAVWFR